MTVAILNSNAHSHVHKRGEYADYSPCHTFFRLRYALGIHNAKNDDLKRFETRDDYHNYVSCYSPKKLCYQTLGWQRCQVNLTSKLQILARIQCSFDAVI